MSSIRNKDGIWINSKVFSEEASHFLKYGRFCDDPVGSLGYNEYWDEQERRIKEGYSVGGAYITGEHYFYLNFCPIKRIFADDAVKQGVLKDRKAARKSTSFPDFWDGDYNYYHIKEIAAFGTTQEKLDSLMLDVNIKHLTGGKHLIIGKSRRKGFSYKNGSIAAHQYTTVRDSLSIICAYQKKYLYPKGTMTMALNYLNFLNENTDFAKRRLIDKQDHVKAGFKEKINGIEIEKGYKSEIIALTFKDNPDAIRGKDGNLVLMEEVGDWIGMKDAFAAIFPSVQDGDIITGQIIMFGTGGDMAGGTIDFNEMFYNPEPYNLMAFDNIWDDNAANTTCGYFFPVYQNQFPHIDEQGNSLKEKSIDEQLKKRKHISETSKDKKTLTKYCTEYPFSPREAFSISSGNIFPVADLLKQLGEVQSTTDGYVKGTKGTLVINNVGLVEFEPDLDNKLRQVDFPLTSDDTNGCVVIWEHPKKDTAYGFYIAGTDPYAQDKSVNSPSVGATYILERASIEGSNHDRIVAEYCGRPSTIKEHNENVRRLLMYYNNAVDLYENNINNLKEYFETKNCLHLLARKPTIITSNANSTVTSLYGQKMTKQVKDELEIYLRDWLMEEIGDGKMNLHYIYSIPLLKELISYNEDGNFDRVIALMLAIAQKLQIHKITAKKKEEIKRDDFFNRPLFVNKRSNGNKLFM
ncbi:MAG TPA: hypothetical protein VIK84_02625 [Haloplasmataceae bacterium]